MYYMNGFVVGNIYLLFVLFIFVLLCKLIIEEENINILLIFDKNFKNMNIYFYYI